MRCDDERAAGRRVAREDDLAALARRSHHLLGPDAIDGLAMLEAAKGLAWRDAEMLRGPRVEFSRPVGFDEGIAERCALPVRDGYRGNRIAVALDALRRLELDDAQLEGKAPVDDRHRAHEVTETPRAIQPERLLAFAQGEGLEHPGDPQPVVGAEMGDADALEFPAH